MSLARRRRLEQKRLDTFMRAVLFRNYIRRVADAASPLESLAEQNLQRLS
jgi:hypothetical protein